MNRNHDESEGGAGRIRTGNRADDRRRDDGGTTPGTENTSGPAHGRTRGATVDRETESTAPARPETTSDLVARPLLAVAEVLMLPLFWLAPLALLVLGGAMAADMRRTDARVEAYGLEDVFDDRAYLYCAMPFVLSHLGTLCYRIVRITKLREAHGISASAFARQVDRRNPRSGRVVGGVFGLQLLGVIGLFLHAAAGWLAVIGLLIAPIVVWYDSRSVRAIDGVDWGWTRYAHVALGWLPGATLVYVVSRQQQVQLATLLALWAADLESLEPPTGEKTRLERISDWVDERT